jgi:hypothetical protein
MIYWAALNKREGVSWAAAAVVLTSFPYVAAWLRAPAGASYGWILPPYPTDSLAYFSWVKEAQSGAWLFTLKYTIAHQRAAMFHPLFLLAGWICRATGWSAGFCVFVLRGAGTALFALSLERLLRRLPLTASQRPLAMALVLLSSGFGGLAAALAPGWTAAHPPTDLWLLDVNTLWSLTWGPLFPFGWALMLESLRLLLEPDAARRDASFLKAGALVCLLAFVHPYDAATMAFLAVVLGLSRPGGLRAAAAFAAAAAPGALVQVALSRGDPVLARTTQLAADPSPGLLALALGLGLPGLLAAAQAWRVVKDGRAAQFRPLLAWAGGALLLCRAPVWFQRKLLGGVHIPICLLAAPALEAAAGRLAKLLDPRSATLRRTLIFALVALTAATHLVNARASWAVLRESGDWGPYYLDADLTRAFDYLSANTGRDEVVVAQLQASRLIPAWAGNTVPFGHWGYSVEPERLQWAASVFSPESGWTPERRAAELRAAGIRYVFVDPDLLMTLGGAVPAWLTSATTKVYRGGRVEILRLTDAPAAGARSL